MTARAIAARSAPGVSRPPVQHLGLGGGRLVRVQQRGGGCDGLGLVPGDDPVQQRRPRAGQPGAERIREAQQGAGVAAGVGQGAGQLIGGELRVLRPGIAAAQLGDGGQLAGRGVRLDPVPGAPRPASSASDTPANPSSPPQAASAAAARPAQPGSTSSAIPGPNPAAGLADSPGNTRDRLARPAPPGSGRLDREELIGGRLLDLGQLRRREGLVIPVVIQLGWLVFLADPVQVRLTLRRRHRIPVQPGEIVVSPGSADPAAGHGAHPFGRIFFEYDSVFDSKLPAFMQQKIFIEWSDDCDPGRGQVLRAGQPGSGTPSRLEGCLVQSGQ